MNVNGFKVINSLRGCGLSAIVTAHLLRPGSKTTLCGLTTTGAWSRKWNTFEPRQGDCKRCAAKLSKEQQKDGAQ